MEKLTNRQKDVLDFVKKYTAKHASRKAKQYASAQYIKK